TWTGNGRPAMRRPRTQCGRGSTRSSHCRLKRERDQQEISSTCDGPSGGKRVPNFARDIRPLFRDQDVEEMQFAFDLSEYDDVKPNAEAILEGLSDGSMPCDGAWSDEQIELFRQWMQEGYEA